jgi:hypothetical protein
MRAPQFRARLSGQETNHAYERNDQTTAGQEYGNLTNPPVDPGNNQQNT